MKIWNGKALGGDGKNINTFLFFTIRIVIVFISVCVCKLESTRELLVLIITVEILPVTRAEKRNQLIICSFEEYPSMNKLLPIEYSQLLVCSIDKCSIKTILRFSFLLRVVVINTFL